MAKRVKDNNPVQWVPVAEIGVVWPEAQRDLEESTVNRIVNDFDPDALGILQLAQKNGKGLYHPVDGQHRAEALRRMGYIDQLVKAEIHDIHNAQDAAHLFDLLNTAKNPNALAKFKVRVTAGREEENDIADILRRAGFRVGMADSWRAIGAVGTVRELYRKFGGDLLFATLQTIAATWKDDHYATSSTVLRGYGYVIGEYSDVLDYKRLRERIGRKYTAANLVAAAKHTKNIMNCNITQGAMTVIVAEYNRGIKGAGRLDMPV